MTSQLPSIWFTLDKEDGVYQCGERIKGTLGTDIPTPLLVAGIEIRFHGVARACWREAPYNDKKSSEVEHEKEEIYFDDRFCLWGSEEKQATITLPFPRTAYNHRHNRGYTLML